jgi:hypothetical protein
MKDIGNYKRLGPPRAGGNQNIGTQVYTDLANIFSAAQKVSLATSGLVQTFESTANDANAGITDYYRRRGTAAGVDGDDLWENQYNGLDDNASPAKTKYARTLAEIVDSGDGSEDGRYSIGTIRAGTVVDWRFESGAVYYQTLTAPAAAGAFNGTDVQVNDLSIAHGVAQRSFVSSATYATCATDLPVDNTIPTDSEGDQVLTSGAFTPKAATSTLMITVDLHVGATSAGTVAAALYVAGTTNAISYVSGVCGGSTSTANLIIRFSVSAASTAARTYNVRLGPDVGGPASARLNGDGTSRLGGGVQISSIEIVEYFA